MNTLEIGIDLLRVTEVAEALRRFGDRYIRRAFTKDESAYCLAAVGDVAAARFAARFAAKEAVVKALRPDVRWHDWAAIEIRRAPSGHCNVALHREARVLAKRRRIRHFSLSMTHDGAYVAAVAIATREILPETSHDPSPVADGRHSRVTARARPARRRRRVALRG